MTTKEILAGMLESAEPGEYISGNQIAQELGITRAAVWKNIRLLGEDGYSIEAVTNRGYRLSDINDFVCENSIRKYLDRDSEDYTVEVFNKLSSTNTYMKEKADSLPDWHTVIAGRQTAGRGRSGRSFFSPPGTGLYLSMIQRPAIAADQAVRITTAAAVAACRAIEECTDAAPEIKWVNDVFVNGRKVCGILTEASFNMENGALEWVVMGIGFNVYEPQGGFPEEIADTAGAISKEPSRDLRSRLAVSFMKHFRKLSGALDDPGCYEEYRKRSFLIGKKIYVMKPGGAVAATALDVDHECRLMVRYEDGKEETLSSGEVSIRPAR